MENVSPIVFVFEKDIDLEETVDDVKTEKEIDVEAKNSRVAPLRWNTINPFWRTAR